MSTLPRPEHPRPNLHREHWLNLNGTWRFAFDPGAIGEQMRWQSPESPHTKEMTITVPYPWESPLSGVAATNYKGAAWYEREFTVPTDWQGLKPILHFGAIDWSAHVWVNGRLVAEHEHGYLPFSCDLSEQVQPGETATVTVRAYDIADAVTLVGKQVPRWYTHSSGIWQTVWLEGCAPTYVEAVHITPDVAQEQAEVRLTINVAKTGNFTLRLYSPDGAFEDVEQNHELAAGQQQVNVVLPVPSPQLWSPETPYLYDLHITLEPSDGSAGDSVFTYFGMRTISRAGWNGREYEYILLNGKPAYLRGALDQAFHPDGLHTYPSDDDIRADIQLAKDLGLNMLRCHIKLNEPRYYYWADRLGLLIMYDLPSPDLDTPSMRQLIERTIHRTLERDFNSPSIFAWVIFNETWGLSNHDQAEAQEWVRHMVALTRKLDPTRLVEDNSPCLYDHVETDINSWHFYINDYMGAKRHIQMVVDETYRGSRFNYIGEHAQGNEPLMNSEYGGIGARSGDQDIAWCFKYLTNELRLHAKICGYVYTELSDIEWEHNGFVNYDRSAKEFGYDSFVPEMGVDDLNSADFVGIDAPPCQTLALGSSVQVPLFVSHYGPEMGQATVEWQLNFTDGLGQQQTIESGALSVQPQRYDVLMVNPLNLTLPDEPGLATVALQLKDETGQIRCRNYINIEVRSKPSARVEQTENDLYLRFAPGDYSRTSWVRTQVDPKGAKLAAGGSGWVEYKLALPPDFDTSQLRGLRLYFEAGARAGGRWGGTAKIDWPQRTYGLNYPQTEVDKKTPSNLTVSINNIEIGTVHLPDDPADARGVLSHHHGHDPGSYGYLYEVALSADALDAIRQSLQSGEITVRFAVPADTEYSSGMALYGETAGCYPLDPTLVFELE